MRENAHNETGLLKHCECHIDRLRRAGVSVKFVTNTTKEPLRVLHDRLCMLGFDIGRDEVFTSLTAARRVVEGKGMRPLLLLEECAKEDFKGGLRRVVTMYYYYYFIHLGAP